MGLTFQKAVRRRIPLKIGIAGPSGSGKTLGALALARRLMPAGRIAVVDTENGSASLYADECSFEVLELRPPYLTKKYLEAMDAALEAKFDLLIVDSISHQWDGEGGILQRKEQADARGGNHFSNWAPFTKEHNAFRSRLLNYPIPLLATMRSKQAYQVEENGGKKAAPKKLGLQPIQREGMDYEFTVCFDLQMDHRATTSKDRTKLFTGQLVDLLDPATADAIKAWHERGEEVAPGAATNDRDEGPGAVLCPAGANEGTPLRDLDDKTLLNMAAWCHEHGKYPEVAEAAILVVDQRQRDREEAQGFPPDALFAEVTP